MSTFYQNIKPFIEEEIEKSRNEMINGNAQAALTHLENAHVLGQNTMRLHVKVHYLMLIWGINQKDFREIFGQTLRIPGTILFTWINKLPTGNIGSTRVSAFEKMEISEKHLEIIMTAKKK